jgi:hypothetical protein
MINDPHVILLKLLRYFLGLESVLVTYK